jgi:deazaflavin-dependent oxidoreductase (nitroreductase family)
LLVMTSKGAKSGEPRRAILTYHRDRDDYIVAGTAGGAPTTPAWVHNLETNPVAGVETGTETFDVTAEVIRDGAERDRLWTDHVAALPWFAPYPEQSGRTIPMVRLSRVR